MSTNATKKDAFCSTEGSPSGSKTNHPTVGDTTHGKNLNPNNGISKQKFSSSEKGKGILQVESLDEQLEKVKMDSLKVKANSLMGFIFGDPIHFDEIKERLTSSWRLVHGEVDIYDRSHGWFECVFYKSIDKTRVWEGRPYHVRGQLVLLRPWRVDFIPESEDTNVLDLWIRILNLPPALACNQGVKAIVEKNGVGKFIKFDHACGGQYSRVCVNMDITKGVVGDVKLSEKRDDEIPLNIWFEDFPNGCGNCGNTNHVYKACPLRKFIPKQINITIIKRGTPVSHIPSDMQQDHPNDPEQNQKEADWSPVQKGRRRSRKKLPITPQGIKPYISGMSGVTITYKTIEKKATETREEESSPPMGKETHQAVGDDQNQLLPKEGQSSQKKSEDTSIPDMEAEIQPATNLSPTDEEEYVEAEEDLEAVYENDEAAGEDLEAIMEDGDVGMEDDENDGEEELGEDLSLMAAVQPAGPIKPPTDSMSNLAIVAHTISTSDSLKRKGEEDGGEDTASSKLKRSKLSKFP